ncbi:MAG: SOS response-associated peptidase [candidate division Zixibacteria bacterium]|nr:SOS response-associated peptidase [candidate division Zixibacteria bacterium]
MCGRYTLTTDTDGIVKRFKIKDYQAEHRPRYNVAPTQKNPVVLLNEETERIMTDMRWGLIPSWAKDEKIGYQMINARVETVAEKPSFRKAFITRICLVPADGYYEWQKTGKPGRKLPYMIVLESRELFAFAGLWEAWKNPEGEIVHSYTIITTEADDLVTRIHPRMPIILRPENEDIWIDPDLRDTESLMKQLNPYPSNFTEMYEVSPAVGRANIDVEELTQPIRRD